MDNGRNWVVKVNTTDMDGIARTRFAQSPDMHHYGQIVDTDNISRATRYTYDEAMAIERNVPGTKATSIWTKPPKIVRGAYLKPTHPMFHYDAYIFSVQSSPDNWGKWHVMVYFPIDNKVGLCQDMVWEDEVK